MNIGPWVIQYLKREGEADADDLARAWYHCQTMAVTLHQQQAIRRACRALVTKKLIAAYPDTRWGSLRGKPYKVRCLRYELPKVTAETPQTPPEVTVEPPQSPPEGEIAATDYQKREEPYNV